MAETAPEQALQPKWHLQPDNGVARNSGRAAVHGGYGWRNGYLEPTPLSEFCDADVAEQTRARVITLHPVACARSMSREGEATSDRIELAVLTHPE